MQIKALHKDFIMPTKGSQQAGGWDLYMPTDGFVVPNQVTSVPLGFSAAVPEGFVALLLPRSGTGSRGLDLMNTVGVIDADYRGEWMAKLTIKADQPGIHFKKGERLLQMVLVPVYIKDMQLVEELPSTERGSGGFGSSGQ